ncbi:uncharacterized protein PV09_02786 [Verruconis gallopava]|uniref:Disintegrin and metalloproteinase domain-containing protein B n=1 Tax=Verruconis gallopava TaxID=253628 RepID=A0A0D1Z037_9PEZI|nr:uncharacterized protein PV09_02786 [Verruconis gallopava]KIW06322.1 hypothetical protein PV09_02786 [Verruconis gallopava]
MLLLLWRSSVWAVLFASLVLAHSQARNPLTAVSSVRDASINTPAHRVNALQSFELSLSAFKRSFRLKLQPNHDVLADGATVSYLGPDGQVLKTEPIDRMAHKVYAGETWRQNLDGSYAKVGSARLSVYRDGDEPLFEGVLGVEKEHYHIQMAKNYMKTRHLEDPTVQLAGEDYMIIWRDSDLHTESSFHSELKRDVPARSCDHDSLDFNVNPSHPVYRGIGSQDDGTWGFTPISSLFGKRQLDSSTSGNSAGVNLVSTIGSTAGCPSMRKVALVGVATDCSYTATFANETETRQNVINQMNSASEVYEKSFNISLGLANLIVSPQECPGSAPASAPWNVACSDSVDIQDRLNLFSQWRGGRSDNYSHWTLLTNCNSGSAVGLAWLGQACVNTAQNDNTTSTGNGASGSTNVVSGANVVAKTSTEWQVIAHETGHTFGAVHDCTSQTCSDGTSTRQQCCPLSSSTCDAGEKYIMNPSTGVGITAFSACSIGNICSAIGRSSVRTSCLSNNKDVSLITGQQCGNGIVEPGEECDCGGTANCGNDPCCDPTTCKFINGAVCDDANEECCNNCQLASADTVCRASTGVCDPEEKCTGTSPTCPPDVTAPNGQSCGSGLQCASGQCTSRDQQCKSVMGSYTQGNDTYACDSLSCTLSCASPEFGPGVCYGLQQNFLDGTPCGGGGMCSNGQCKGSSFGKEIKSWIDDHKGLVIGIASALGALILLMILSCCWRAFQRRKYGKAAALRPWPGARAYPAVRSGKVGNPSQLYPPPPLMRNGGMYMNGPPPAYPGPGGNMPYPSQSVRYA